MFTAIIDPASWPGIASKLVGGRQVRRVYSAGRSAGGLDGGIMRRSLMALLALLVAITLACRPAVAERRVALVVGNAHYANTVALRNPVNDAEDVAAELKQLGFDVTLATDVEESAFARQIDDFGRRLEGADIGLFYYAGHGLQVDDKNYLVSTNAKLESEFLVPSETIEVDAIVRLMESRAALNIVFLDACRNNPLADNLRRSLIAEHRSVSLGRGLARIEPTGRDTLVAFSAAPGQEAADGDGRNSPFAAALLRHMPEPGLEVSVMLKLVSAEVREATHSAQRPQQLSDMTQAFYFAGAAASATKPAAAAAVSPPSPFAPDRSVELAYFQSAAAGNDCASIRSYLDRFPDGTFADLAKLMEARLCKPAAPVAAPAIAAAPPQVAEPARPATPIAEPAARVVPPAFIAALPAPTASTPGAPSPADIARHLQSELLRVGCGDPDLTATGEWDAASKSALARFNRFARTKLTEPNEAAIAAVHSRDGRVCPLVCGPGMRAEGDTCVAAPSEPPSRSQHASRPRPGRANNDSAPPPTKHAARERPNPPESSNAPTVAPFAGSTSPFTGPGGRKCHTLDLVGQAPHIVCD